MNAVSAVNVSIHIMTGKKDIAIEVTGALIASGKQTRRCLTFMAEELLQNQNQITNENKTTYRLRNRKP
jgi:hypothetical protein